MPALKAADSTKPRQMNWPIEWHLNAAARHQFVIGNCTKCGKFLTARCPPLGDCEQQIALPPRSENGRWCSSSQSGHKAAGIKNTREHLACE